MADGFDHCADPVDDHELRKVSVCEGRGVRHVGLFVHRAAEQGLADCLATHSPVLMQLV